MTGWATTAVAVKTKSATTTIRAIAATPCVAGAVRHQHEEGDAGAGAEEHGGAEDVKPFKDK